MDEIRRDDGELCGHVVLREGQWCALVVVGAELGRHPTRAAAVAHVLADGLASLAERWTLRRDDGGPDQVVCIQEANAATVTLALDVVAFPGVPTLTLTAADLAGGGWSLQRSAPR